MLTIASNNQRKSSVYLPWVYDGLLDPDCGQSIGNIIASSLASDPEPEKVSSGIVDVQALYDDIMSEENMYSNYQEAVLAYEWEQALLDTPVTVDPAQATAQANPNVSKTSPWQLRNPGGYNPYSTPRSGPFPRLGLPPTSSVSRLPPGAGIVGRAGVFGFALVAAATATDTLFNVFKESMGLDVFAKLPSESQASLDNSNYELPPMDSQRLAFADYQAAGGTMDFAQFMAAGSGNPGIPSSITEINNGLKYGKFYDTYFEGRKVFKNAIDVTPDAPDFVHRSVNKSIRTKVNDGWSNLDLMQSGYAPIGPDGKQINLHHILGVEPGPMVELTTTVHKTHHKALHGLIEPGLSFRNDSKLLYQYDTFRRLYWQARALDFM